MDIIPPDADAGVIREPVEKTSDHPTAPDFSLLQRTTPGQIVLVALGMIAFLYFARPVLLPIALACIAGMTLKPLICWASRCYLPKALSSALVLCLLISVIVIGFIQLGRPALDWMSNAPEHMTELRQRVQKLMPRIGSFNQAAAAVSNLGATVEEKKPSKRSAPRSRSKSAAAPAPF